LARYSPFGASQFITHTVYESWATSWLMLIGVQVFWILVFALIVSSMFERARKKVSVNGG
jgi:hypothetical protein